MESKPKKVALAVVWDEPEHEVGIARYARRAGWTLSKIVPGQEDRLAESNPDGIVCQLHESAPAFVEAVCAQSCPKVELSHNIPGLAVPRVRRDSHLIGEMAVRHFIERGFSHVCYVGLCQDTAIERSFYSGCIAAIAATGCSVTSLFLDDPCSAPSFPSGITDRYWIMDALSSDCRQWFGAYMAALPSPLGVFVWNINYCIDLIEGCLNANLLIPEQIAVVTVGTSDTDAEFSPVPVSCIIPNFRLQAYRASILLHRMMSGTPVAPATRFVAPRKLITRESSDIYAVDHVETARVIRYIMKNLSQAGLSTRSLLRDTSISQWKLYNEIQQHLGCTVSEFIERERIKKACSLMHTTSRSLTRIAEECGFSELRQFRRAMKRVKGAPPSTVRKQVS